MSSRNRKTPKNAQRRVRKKHKNRTGGSSYANDIVPITSPKRHVGLAPQTDTMLDFFTQFVLNNATNQFAGRRMNPNAAYDVDPTLGSTATIGFAEMANVYQSYRVIAYSYRIEVVNRESFPVNAVVLNTNLDPGTNTTSYITYRGNDYCFNRTLGPATSGQCRAVFRGSFTVQQIVGSGLVVEADDSFQSVYNNVPGNRIWTSIGIDAFGTALSQGVICTVDIRMKTRFTEKKLLST